MALVSSPVNGRFVSYTERRKMKIEIIKGGGELKPIKTNRKSLSSFDVISPWNSSSAKFQTFVYVCDSVPDSLH